MKTVFMLWVVVSACIFSVGMAQFTCKTCGKVFKWWPPILRTLFWPFLLAIPIWGCLMLLTYLIPTREECYDCDQEKRLKEMVEDSWKAEYLRRELPKVKEDFDRLIRPK